MEGIGVKRGDEGVGQQAVFLKRGEEGAGAVVGEGFDCDVQLRASADLLAERFKTQQRFAIREQKRIERGAGCRTDDKIANRYAARRFVVTEGRDRIFNDLNIEL